MHPFASGEHQVSKKHLDCGRCQPPSELGRGITTFRKTSGSCAPKVGSRDPEVVGQRRADREAVPSSGLCPSQISEPASSRSALQPEPIVKDLTKPSPAEGTVSELFFSDKRSPSLFWLLCSPVCDGTSPQKQFGGTGGRKRAHSS